MKIASEPRSSAFAFLVLAFAGYVLGAYVGLALRFPPATTSVLWPPNAILAALLLLTPRPLWWACFAGTFAAHLIVQLTLGWPLALVLPLFFTNCSEALITAVGIRWFVRGATRFDSLRDVGVFIAFAGLISPIVSSFADAAVVHFVQGEPYWGVWGTRVFANSLSELSIVPMVVCGAEMLAPGAPRLSGRKIAELALLTSGLLVVALIALGPSLMGVSILGVHRMPTVFLTPLLLWAAMRFGAGVIGATLFVGALMGSLGAISGSRPFAVLAPSDSLVALQMYLALTAIPLFTVSALLDERRRSATELAHRWKFEQALGRVAAAFVDVRRDQFDATVDSCMAQVGEYFGADRVVLAEQSASGHGFDTTHRWVKPGLEQASPAGHLRDFPWSLDQLLGNEPVVYRDVDDFPEAAVHDRAAFARLALGAAMVAPFVLEGRRRGVLCLGMSSRRDWLDEETQQARLFGELLGHAMVRKNSETALRESEALKAAILSSLSSLVTVLNRHGDIIAVHDRGLRSATPSGQSESVKVGVNYVDLWRTARRGGAETAVIIAGLEDVLGGRRTSFGIEYPNATCDTVDWYAMSVVPLLLPEGGAVVSHVDITKRKVAELESQRTRQELGHFARVATMGELTASLAHQLNQPLTGILSNAQAASRLLDAPIPDLVELREIVADIINDDRRASTVIRHMRKLMTKNVGQPEVLDLNGLILDVASMFDSESIIRQVTILFALSPDQPRVSARRVELQQVILNLIVNALDAVADRPAADRLVAVRSGCEDGQSVLVAVEDSGAGLVPGTEAHVFEPFFTTKREGMGMGLAIARSIVESCSGRIWTEPRREAPGAAFIVKLPVAAESRN